VKMGKSNLGPDNLSRIDSRVDGQRFEDIMPDAQLFRLQCAPFDLQDIVVFLKMGMALEGMKTLERKKLAIHVTPYMLISGDLYKLCRDEVLHQCMFKHERTAIMEEAHGGIAGGHYAGN
ncbi:hypothetical protein KI387_028607, partial [Taxus chinensis]